MPDPVACAQCGVRYDPVADAFCPRCGSTTRNATVPPALAAAQRADPGRRRVQASGAVLSVVGGILVLLFLPVLIFSSGLTGDMLNDLSAQPSDFPIPGGNLHVLLLEGGAAREGVAITVDTPAGTNVATGPTDSVGRFNATLGDHAIVLVTVLAPSGNFTRQAVALDGSTVTMRLDIASDPTSSKEWLGLQPLIVVMRVLLGIFLAVAVLMLAAGICAVRLRAWQFAVTGAVIGMIPALLLFVASLSVGAFLILVVLAVPTALIGRGRRHFAR